MKMQDSVVVCCGGGREERGFFQVWWSVFNKTELFSANRIEFCLPGELCSKNSCSFHRPTKVKREEEKEDNQQEDQTEVSG